MNLMVCPIHVVLRSGAEIDLGENLNPDFPIERTLIVISGYYVKDWVET